jgi:N-dimethylarginine dimethylaminohydrolase
MRVNVAPSPHRFVVSDPRCSGSCAQAGDACAFQIKWAINPHMRIGAVRSGHAVRQHGTFVRALEAAGAVTLPLPFVHGAYDSVFSKDNAVLVEHDDGVIEALLARPRHAERRIEQKARAAALSGLGVRVSAASSEPLEGGDIVMLPGARGAFLGHGFRSSRRASADLERFLDRAVTAVELRDPRLYHLDMALSVLDDGTALICDEALTDAGRRAVENHDAVTEIIHVPLHEALRFGVNLVQVGKTVVWGAEAPATTHALEARGYRVRRVDLDQFHHAGGSAACLVSRIHAQVPAESLFDAPRSTAA